MKIKYAELIDQTLYFPQEEFKYEDQQLYFHDIPLMDLVEKFGTPLKFSYLPKISQNIQRAKTWFKDAIKKNEYKNSYRYCYCTKSSHFSFVLEEALKNDISIETSSAFDMNIVKNLFETGKIDKTIEVVCNGFKTDDYLAKISDLINNGFENVIPVLDNYRIISFRFLHNDNENTSVPTSTTSSEYKCTYYSAESNNAKIGGFLGSIHVRSVENEGVETDASTLKMVKDAVPDTVVFANTGLKLSNVQEQLSIADGAVVGTTFKIDGKFVNHVDQSRVKEFMDKVKSIR